MRTRATVRFTKAVVRVTKAAVRVAKAGLPHREHEQRIAAAKATHHKRPQARRFGAPVIFSTYQSCTERFIGGTLRDNTLPRHACHLILRCPSPYSVALVVPVVSVVPVASVASAVSTAVVSSVAFEASSVLSDDSLRSPPYITRMSSSKL